MKKKKEPKYLKPHTIWGSIQDKKNKKGEKHANASSSKGNKRDA